ncbi:MAG TPA: Na+/H+ antiporter subunit D, partial [Candidatus Nocardiopsis merdipullorum]|nr:Na+/H+ antiporter subunit D [Candidatus Nocardiopsis merdipullorum]
MTMGSLFADSLHLLVPLPVILPLFAAGVKLALGGRRPKLQQAVSLITLTVVLIVGALLMVGSQRYGPQAVQIGGWGTPIGITVVADQLAALMVTVSAAITLAV